MRIKRPLGQAGDGNGPKRITLTPLQDAEPIDGTAALLSKPRSENRVGGRLSPKEIAAALTKPARMQAIRAYRSGVDEAIQWVRLGVMDPKSGSLLVGMYKAGAELLMTEKIMEAAAQRDLEPDHPLGDSGGFEPIGVLPTPARTVRLERKTGVGADGNVIDETTVEVVGGADIAEQASALGSLDATALEDGNE